MDFQRLKRCAVGTFTLVLCTFAFAQDFDREARWRAEVEPTVLVGDTVSLRVDAREVFAIFTEGTRKDAAIVLVHGVGVHPDHGLIGKLRTALADAGWSSLSVQMPVLAKEVTDAMLYQATFPNAAQRIEAAAAWLGAKGFGTRVLVSHSMGAWMSNEYLANAKDVPFHAWAAVGITGRIGSTGKFNGPILDLSGENDLKPNRDGAWMRKLKLMWHAGSQTVVIPEADHFYAGKEALAANAIATFVEQVVQREKAKGGSK